MTFWYGIWILLFSSLAFKVPTKISFFPSYFCLLLFELKVHLHQSSKRYKVIKKSQNSCNQGFSYFFCLMIEGSGSGSGRPNNLRIWIRIHNTGFFVTSLSPRDLRSVRYSMCRYLSSKENCEEGKAARLTTSFLGLLEDLHKSVEFMSAMCTCVSDPFSFDPDPAF